MCSNVFVLVEGISVILVSEIGDKTFFIAAILAMQESDFNHLSNGIALSSSSRKTISVAELHRLHVAPGTYFDAAPVATAPAPTVLYTKPNFLKQTKVNMRVDFKIVIKVNGKSKKLLQFVTFLIIYLF
jgi:Uncharacterized protein family UPF0016